MIVKHKEFKQMSREDMKVILGGKVQQNPGCNLEAACTLTLVSEQGNVTFYGECGVINGHCKCVTSAGDYQPTSNGGISRCGSL